MKIYTKVLIYLWAFLFMIVLSVINCSGTPTDPKPIKVCSEIDIEVVCTELNHELIDGFL